MNLRDLQAFIAVAETGSVSRAARRLHLTQPAVTRRVQNFESAMGAVTLIDRNTKPLTLTPAGRQILERCRDVQTALVALRSESLENGEPAGELRIGVGMGAEIVLGSPLDEVRRRFPRIELRVTTNWTARLIEDLRNGNLDLAVAYVTQSHAIPASIKTTAIGTETIEVVTARNSTLPRARDKSLHICDLTEQRWILNPVGCAYRLAVQRAYDAAGVPLRLAAEVIGRDLQLSLVARGAGLGLVSRRTFNSGTYRRALRIVRIEDFRLESSVTLLRSAALGSFNCVADLLQERVTQRLQRR